MNKFAQKFAAFTISAALIQACSTTPQMQERFSESSATTWRVAGTAMVFERTEARFSRSGRDYVYLGPVALNRRGLYEYVLWIGIGSTLDRGFLAPEATLPTTITLIIDGEPLELVTTEWNRRVTDLAGEIPYDPPVAPRWQLAARVTLDQIAMIDSRGLDRLMLHTGDGNAREFYPWEGRSAWQSFVSQSPQ